MSSPSPFQNESAPSPFQNESSPAPSPFWNESAPSPLDSNINDMRTNYDVSIVFMLTTIVFVYCVATYMKRKQRLRWRSPCDHAYFQVVDRERETEDNASEQGIAMMDIEDATKSDSDHEN